MSRHRQAPTLLRPPPPARRRGFTLVEMLIVVAVIVILLGILIVGLNQATKRAQMTHTQTLMNSMNQALVRFKSDIGYYPPVLDDDRSLNYQTGGSSPFPSTPWQDEDDYIEKVQKWSSVTSLAEYLIGYGNHRQDGYGYVPGAQAIQDWDLEQPPLGIRHPGPDGVWGALAGAGELGDRMHPRDGPYSIETDPRPYDQGKVYGPYLELGDERLLGALVPDTSDYKIVFPGQADYDPDAPKVIVDYWGNPIWYHRRLHPPGVLKQSYRSLDYDGDGKPDPVPKLSDVICLRSYYIPPGQSVDAVIQDENGDPSTTVGLQSAEFALFSPGPDKVSDHELAEDEGRLPYRIDPNQYNRDNIVEAGP